MTHKKHTTGQSFAGYVREHLEQINQRVKNGVRYETLHREFVELGFDVGLGTFRGALYRARSAEKRALTEQGTTRKTPSGDKTKSGEGVQAVTNKTRADKLGGGDATGTSGEVDYFARKSIFKRDGE